MHFKHQGWRHHVSPCNNDCDVASLLGCQDARVRSHNVMPRDAMMMRVMIDAPTSIHVAIWYSMRGLGVGSGVVVTSTVKQILQSTGISWKGQQCFRLDFTNNKRCRAAIAQGPNDMLFRLKSELNYCTDVRKNPIWKGLQDANDLEEDCLWTSQVLIKRLKVQTIAIVWFL